MIAPARAAASSGDRTRGAEAEIDVLAFRRREYEETWQAMRAYTLARDAGSPDQIWIVEHPPVFTLGQAGRREHLLAPGDVPVVHTDRGGQVTYHGPGQAIAYLLLDLRRARLGIKRAVWSLEESVVRLLGAHAVVATRRAGAPGVYVEGAKIAAIGLRVRDGRCYHGIALNVDLDVEPFSRIDPCGYPGLEVTRLADLGIDWSVAEAGRRLAGSIAAVLGRRERDR